MVNIVTPITDIEMELARGFLTGTHANTKTWKLIRHFRKSLAEELYPEDFMDILLDEYGIEIRMRENDLIGLDQDGYDFEYINIIDETKFTMFVLKWSQ